MYNLLVKVFHANDRKWMYMYLALGWGKRCVQIRDQITSFA